MSVCMAANGRNGERFLVLFCPGCQETHSVPIGGPGKLWAWNDNADAPSLSPAVDIRSERTRCRFFVVRGWIQYVEVTTHRLRGQAIRLEDW